MFGTYIRLNTQPCAITFSYNKKLFLVGVNWKEHVSFSIAKIAIIYQISIFVSYFFDLVY